MIEDRLKSLRLQLPVGVTLIAVSKTKSEDLILQAYKIGQRDFGENKVQELVEKAENLPKDIHWHLIGHLQTNKVKYIAPFIHLIHSVDSLKLLSEINKQALKNDRVIDCLLQFHVAQEETKFGLDLAEAEALLGSPEYALMHNLRITGIMGMASFTNNEKQIREEFRSLKTIFEYLKKNVLTQTYFNQISMGMSGDYTIAVEEGSTMVRIGSTIFGERNNIKN